MRFVSNTMKKQQTTLHLSEMTITERNQKLYDLRVKLDKARAQVAWIEQEIWLTRDEYNNQDLNLFEEMFGDS